MTRELEGFGFEAARMLDFFNLQRDWSYETFGPPEFRGPTGPLDHLAKEAVEAWNACILHELGVVPMTKDQAKEEIADCLFLVFDAAHRAGMSFTELAEKAHAKLAKNKARTWPDWRGTDPSKAVEHDRSKE